MSKLSNGRVGGPTLRRVAMLCALSAWVCLLGACPDRQPSTAQHQAAPRESLCTLPGKSPSDGGLITYSPDGGGFDNTSLCVAPKSRVTFKNNDPANELTICFHRLDSEKNSPFDDEETHVTVPADGGTLSKTTHPYKLKKSLHQFRKSEDGGCDWSDGGDSHGGMSGTLEVGSGGGHELPPHSPH